MTAGFVEPLSRPVGLGVSVALAKRGATGMLKQRRLGLAAESGQGRKRSLGKAPLFTGQLQYSWNVSTS